MNFFHLPNTCVHGHLTVTLVSTEWNSGTGQVRPGPKLTGVQVSKRVKSSLSKLVLHRIKKKKKVPKHTAQDSTQCLSQQHIARRPRIVTRLRDMSYTPDLLC